MGRKGRRRGSLAVAMLGSAIFVSGGVRRTAGRASSGVLAMRDFVSNAGATQLTGSGEPSGRPIVARLGCWRQRQTGRTQFIALRIVLVRRLHEGEGAAAESADATVGEGH